MSHELFWAVFLGTLFANILVCVAVGVWQSIEDGDDRT